MALSVSRAAGVINVEFSRDDDGGIEGSAEQWADANPDANETTTWWYDTLLLMWRGWLRSKARLKLDELAASSTEEFEALVKVVTEMQIRQDADAPRN